MDYIKAFNNIKNTDVMEKQGWLYEFLDSNGTRIELRMSIP